MLWGGAMFLIESKKMIKDPEKECFFSCLLLTGSSLFISRLD